MTGFLKKYLNTFLKPEVTWLSFVPSMPVIQTLALMVVPALRVDLIGILNVHVLSRTWEKVLNLYNVDLCFFFSTVKNVCENVKCGSGDCIVNLNKNPFYECKCRPPFQGPDCKTLPANPCEPNPCKNGAASDCYNGNGETYRGVVSTTEGGDELHYLSLLLHYYHFRNPDGDDKPWCFFKKNRRLSWEYCKVKKCTESEFRSQPYRSTQPQLASFRVWKIPALVRQSRIHGGSKVFPGAHPWQVSLQERDKGSSGGFGHICGGILLSSCSVLTAGHCISPNKEYQVVVGGVNILRQEEMDQTIPVLDVTVHENYRATPSAVYNDIALLKLKVTDSPYCAKETRFVKAACLPQQPFPAGKECVISGWGATEKNYSPQLLNARVFLISEERCKSPQIYGSALDQSMLCAGVLQGGVDSCQGDSGGPLVCEKDGSYFITGVVSWGHGCAFLNHLFACEMMSKFIDRHFKKMAHTCPELQSQKKF
uniref:trypsin n=1 Tax=Gouania willdenowi TaxID=441366 RepID=A0A8C5HM56_GOUWI